MKKIILTLIALIILFILNAQSNFLDSPDAYFGQAKPGNTAEIFAPGIVSSTTGSENTCSFSPDGREMFFTRWGNNPKLFYSKFDNGSWTAPTDLNFTGKYEMEAIFAPYKNKLFFAAGDMSNGKWSPDELYEVNKIDNSWGSPFKLDAINSTDYDFYASSTIDSVFYYTKATDGPNYIYSSNKRTGVYSTPVKVEATINFNSDCAHPFISPDGSYLIFEVNQKDLYISLKKQDNTWSVSKKLCVGGKPVVSPDGKYLFFTKGNPQDIYWVRIDNKIDSIRNNLFTSILENKKDDEFSIFPNPTTGLFTLNFPITAENNVAIEIYNTDGKLIHLQKFQNITTTIDLTGKPKGIYMINMTIKGEILNKKIWIE
jgi:hypothetical protein